MDDTITIDYIHHTLLYYIAILSWALSHPRIPGPFPLGKAHGIRPLVFMIKNPMPAFLTCPFNWLLYPPYAMFSWNSSSSSLTRGNSGTLLPYFKISANWPL